MESTPFARKRDRRKEDAYQPDQETIRRECERIQSTWSPAERERRRVGRPLDPFTIPEVVDVRDAA